MRKWLIEGSAAVAILFFSSIFSEHAWSLAGWYYLFSAVSVALIVWSYPKLQLTAPFVKTAILFFITVLVTAYFQCVLPQFIGYDGWTVYFGIPTSFMPLVIIVILSNALGRHLPPEVRPATCLAAGMMVPCLHPLGYDLSYPPAYEPLPRLVLIALPVCLSAFIPIRKLPEKLQAIYAALEAAVVVLIWWLFAVGFTYDEFLIQYYLPCFAFPAMVGSALLSVAALKSNTQSRRGHWQIILLAWFFCFVILPSVGSSVGFDDGEPAIYHLMRVPAYGALGTLLFWLSAWCLRRCQATQFQPADKSVFIWLSLLGWIFLAVGAGLLFL
jgi:hypothetical protein